MQKRFYILFVARGDDGQLRKISIPVHYLYVFVVGAAIGFLSLTGIASSYTRMLLKVSRYNQLLTEKKQITDRYSKLEAVSYTHLDVYKRQPMPCTISSEMPLRSGASEAKVEVTFTLPNPKKLLYGSATRKPNSAWSAMGFLQRAATIRSSTPSPSRSQMCIRDRGHGNNAG